MDYKLERNKGITLVSLVITIIVMLILAGVSLSMVSGDSSVLKQAQKSAFLQEVAAYKEELALSLMGESAKELRVVDKTELTARGETMRKYISKMTDEDIDDYMIVAGELYYVGDDEFEIGVCAELGLSTLPDNKTKEEFFDELEGDAIEAIIRKVSGILTTKPDEEGNVQEIGTPLATKTSGAGFGSSSQWLVISEIKDGSTESTYADGWYYVEKGTDFPNIGPLKYSYIINYTTNDAVVFDSNKHTILTSNGGLAVKEGLVYSADPASMDGTKDSWGDAKLNGFEGTVKDASGNVISGWTKDAFVTDGVDDFVELSRTGLDFKDGYTIECFCKIPNIYANSSQSHVFAKGVDYTTGLSVGLWGPGKSAGYDNTFWFGYQGHRSWNVNFDSLNNRDFYIVIKGDSSNPKGDCYVDNQKLSIRTNGSNTWAKYLEILNDSSKGFIFGKGTDSTGVDFTKMYLYSIRVYNRNLSEEELTANYNATIAYHDILGNDGNAGNNNTGGSDIGTIK